jgi:hypothetical protein
VLEWESSDSLSGVEIDMRRVLVRVIPGEESKQIRSVQTVLNEVELPWILSTRGT